MFQPKRLTKAAADDVGEIVVALRRVLGAQGPLPSERTLAEGLGIKRHRLRQALERMRASGELAAAKGRRPSAGAARWKAMAGGTNPVEVIEMRLLLEPGCARLAALRASPVDIVRIERAATTPPGADYGAVDLAFHKAVAAATRNSLAFAVYELLRRIGTDARLRVGGDGPVCPKRVAQRDGEHRAIAEAIAARDPDRAEAAMRSHLIAVQRQVQDRLAPRADAA